MTRPFVLPAWVGTVENCTLWRMVHVIGGRGADGPSALPER